MKNPIDITNKIMFKTGTQQNMKNIIPITQAPINAFI